MGAEDEVGFRGEVFGEEEGQAVEDGIEPAELLEEVGDFGQGHPGVVVFAVEFQAGFGEEVVADGETVFGDDVCGYAGVGVGHLDWFLGVFEGGEAGDEFVDDGSDENGLETGDGGFAEERFPGSAALAVGGVGEAVEDGDVLLAEHAHLIGS